MAASVDLDGVALLRPLLGVAKRDLVAYCEARVLAYVRDPANEDPRYARTRMRKLAEGLAAEGLDAAALARLARRAGQIEDALARQTHAAALRLGLGAGSSCDAGALLAEPTEIVQRLLAAAIAEVGGRAPSRVGLGKVEALTQKLARAYAAGAPFSANVAGARVRLGARRLAGRARAAEAIGGSAARARLSATTRVQIAGAGAVSRRASTLRAALPRRRASRPAATRPAIAAPSPSVRE